MHSQLTIRNWHLGERIAREELGGAQRAEYGKRVVAQLADDLTARYGKGFDKSSLHAYVKFSRLFPEIVDAVPPQFAIVDAVSPQLLPWTHYRELIRVEDATARVTAIKSSTSSSNNPFVLAATTSIVLSYYVFLVIIELARCSKIWLFEKFLRSFIPR